MSLTRFLLLRAVITNIHYPQFIRCWGLNPGFHAPETSTLPIELHPQSLVTLCVLQVLLDGCSIFCIYLPIEKGSCYVAMARPELTLKTYLVPNLAEMSNAGIAGMCCRA